MAIGLNVWVRRRNRIRRPNQVFGGHNVEAAYPKNPNHMPATGSRTLNAIRAVAGGISNFNKAKRMGKSARRNNPEEIELPRSARVYNGPMNSARGAGVAPEMSRIWREAERKRVDNIQKRKGDRELERQKMRSKMENEPNPPTNGVQDPYDRFERSVTLKEALALVWCGEYRAG